MCAMLPIADAPNEAKLLALPGKGAFEQSAEWRERDRKLVGESCYFGWLWIVC